jgi:hypothetical protein
MARRQRHGRRSGESGQALVEAALTLPLTLFMILGTLQLFLMQQGRVMAEYAAARAVRAGSVNFGDCQSMLHAAIGSLLPVFTRTETPQRLAQNFNRYSSNSYGGNLQGSTPFTGDIVWILREQPTADIPGDEFDTFGTPPDQQRLEVRLVFWYPLRIPFADWVITRMLLAHYGIQSYVNANPLVLAEANANWSGSGNLSVYAHPAVVTEYINRTTSQNENVFPIQATYSMRMMTPMKQTFLNPRDCR